MIWSKFCSKIYNLQHKKWSENKKISFFLTHIPSIFCIVGWSQQVKLLKSLCLPLKKTKTEVNNQYLNYVFAVMFLLIGIEQQYCFNNCKYRQEQIGWFLKAIGGQGGKNCDRREKHPIGGTTASLIFEYTEKLLRKSQCYEITGGFLQIQRRPCDILLRMW